MIHTVSALALVLGARLVAVLALGLAAEAFLGTVAFFALLAAVLGLAAVLVLVVFGLASFSSLTAFSFYTWSVWPMLVMCLDTHLGGGGLLLGRLGFLLRELNGARRTFRCVSSQSHCKETQTYPLVG